MKQGPGTRPTTSCKLSSPSFICCLKSLARSRFLAQLSAPRCWGAPCGPKVQGNHQGAKLNVGEEGRESPQGTHRAVAQPSINTATSMGPRGCWVDSGCRAPAPTRSLFQAFGGMRVVTSWKTTARTEGDFRRSFGSHTG